MQHIQSDIRAFMEKAEQATPQYPITPSADVRVLRAKLIMEEAMEQCEALGVGLFVKSYSGSGLQPIPTIEYSACGEVDPALVADGICDQVYVSVGTAIAFGIDLAPIWKLVQNANMAKFGLGSYRREDGKQMKPPGWTPPDEAIRAEIQSQVKG